MVENITDSYVRTNVESLLFTEKHQTRRRRIIKKLVKIQYDDHKFIRIIEKFMAGFILLVTLPITLIILVIIYVTDRGPVFFKQRRVGHRGKVIHIYKFRTMINDAEKVLKQDILLYEKYIANDFKIPVKDDPRILKVGKFLRKWSLDELPQFINVLKGDMNIVGPRPVFEDQLESYGEDIEIFLSVKPGITGLWQISGRSDIGYPDRKYLDLTYIKHRSFLLDMKIFSKTIWCVLRRNGAY